MQLENINGAVFLKQNDTATEIQLRVLDNLGMPLDLTGQTLEVVIGNEIGRLLVKTPTLLAGVGELSFGLDEGDLLPSGDLRLEVHIIEADGERHVAPSKGFYKLRIQQSIDELQVEVTTVTLQFFLDEVLRKTTNIEQLVIDGNLALTDMNEGLVTMDQAIASANLAVEETTTVKNSTIQATLDANEAVIDVEESIANNTHKGTYDPLVQYLKGNEVRFNGSSYVALQDTIGVAPPSANWTLRAERGLDGLGSVVTVNSVSPNGDGEVTLNPSHIGASPLVHTHVIEDVTGLQAILDDVTTTGESTPLTLSRGLQTVTSPKDSTVRLVDVEGKTVVNHVPLFDSGLWVNTGGTTTVDSPSKITLVATANDQSFYVEQLKAKANTNYTLSSNHNGALRVNDGGQAVNIVPTTTAQTVTFNTGANTSIAVIVMSGSLGAGTYTFEDVMLNEGTTAQEFVANVKGVTNPTIEVKGENLVETDRASWSVGSFITTVGTALRVDNAPTNRIRHINSVRVAPNTAYTPSFVGSYNIYISEVDKNGIVLKNSGWVASGTSFTTDALAERVYVIVKKTDESTMTTSVVDALNPMLNLGSTALPFEPFNGSSLSLKTTLHTGDTVYVDGNGQSRAIRAKKEVVLDGSLAWEFGADFTGVKQIKIPQSKLGGVGISASGVTVKYNGKIIPQGVTSTADNNAVSSDGNFYLGIADIDSGWGETYTPTVAEIKAYFNGWRLGENISQFPTYNGTGVKVWYYYNESGNKTGGTTTLPTTQAPINSKSQPYRLIYDLATPIDESVQSYGSLKLVEGANQTEVTEGRIVRESVRPHVYTNGFTYVNFTTDSITWEALLKHKNNGISELYKDGKPMNISPYVEDMRLQLPSAQSQIDKYGNYRIKFPTNLYDPNATYEVDYIPLEPYKVSARTNAIDVAYQANLGSVVSTLVDDVTDLGQRQSVVENSYVRKGVGVEWITATLQNGWINFGGVEPVAQYGIDAIGNVHLKGMVKLGSASLAVFTLPVGYRPAQAIRVPINSNDKFSAMTINSDGGVYFASTVDGTWVSLKVPPFKAEQ